MLIKSKANQLSQRIKKAKTADKRTLYLGCGVYEMGFETQYTANSKFRKANDWEVNLWILHPPISKINKQVCVSVFVCVCVCVCACTSYLHVSMCPGLDSSKANLETWIGGHIILKKGNSKKYYEKMGKWDQEWGW